MGKALLVIFALHALAALVGLSRILLGVRNSPRATFEPVWAATANERVLDVFTSLGGGLRRVFRTDDARKSGYNEIVRSKNRS